MKCVIPNRMPLHSGIQPPIVLEREAAVLHQVLFRQPISPELAQQYASACSSLLTQASTTQQNSIVALAEKSVDLEAVELALRRRNPNNSLTQRFHVLMYLAEGRSSHFQYYVNKQDSFCRAFFSLSSACIRSFYKLLKGAWQVRHHSVL